MKKKQGFVQGAIILACANLIVKIIGAFYKLPLRRILEAEGMGLYNSAYTIYNVLFIVATAGIPVAISKMISESVAKKNYAETKKIYDVSKLLLILIGVVCTLLMFFGANVFANAIGAPSAKLAVMALAPSLFFVCLMSAYRGFNQGLGNMMPTAVSEVIESMSKLVLGLLLASMLLNSGKEMAAAGSILGVSTGTFIGAVYLFIYNRKNKKELKELSNNSLDNTRTNSKLVKDLLKLAIPITLGSTVFTLASVIDLSTIMNQLKAMGMAESERLTQYGYYTDAITMFNMPTTILSTIGVSIVPSIAGALAVNKRMEAKATIETALRLTFMLALPCAVGLSTLSQPILNLAFDDSSAKTLLSILSYGIIFLSVVMISNSILQSMGKVWVPITNMLIGATIKVVVNLALVSRIGIEGAPVGTVLCYFVTAVLNLIAVRRYGNAYVNISFLVKSIFSAAFMGVLTHFVYKLISDVTDYKIAMFSAIICAVIIYFGCLLILKAIKKEDVDSMPGANKINKIIGRFL